MPLPDAHLIQAMLEIYPKIRDSRWNSPTGQVEAYFQTAKNLFFSGSLESDSAKKTTWINELKVEALSTYSLEGWLKFSLKFLQIAVSYGKCLFSDTLILVRSEILATIKSKDDEFKKEFETIKTKLREQKEKLTTEIKFIKDNKAGEGSERLEKELNHIITTLAYYGDTTSIDEAKNLNLFPNLHVLTKIEREQYIAAVKYYENLSPPHETRPFWLDENVHIYIFSHNEEYQPKLHIPYEQWRKSLVHVYQEKLSQSIEEQSKSIPEAIPVEENPAPNPTVTNGPDTEHFSAVVSENYQEDISPNVNSYQSLPNSSPNVGPNSFYYQNPHFVTRSLPPSSQPHGLGRPRTP